MKFCDLIMIFKDFQEKDIRNASDLIFDISRAVIPFSEIVKCGKSPDIYSGVEDIPFQEREHDYKLILQQEFVIA